MRTEYYKENGEPIKCLYCNSENFDNVTTNRMDSIVLEFKVICCDCGKEIGYWATGYWILDE